MGAERLRDVVKIMGTKSTIDLRALAFKMLDNDVVAVDHALDVLLFTIMGLQPQDQSKWRCAPVPFEVAVPGRLEGEILALGVENPDDHRGLTRRFCSELIAKAVK